MARGISTSRRMSWYEGMNVPVDGYRMAITFIITLANGSPPQ